MNFQRPHHQRIGKLLESLEPAIFSDNHCLFAGGTAIALKYGEYRESVDVDFLVSDLEGYRELRSRIRTSGFQSLMKHDFPVFQTSHIRTDQYGIRTKVVVEGQPIKFEIVQEGRIKLDPPDRTHDIHGIAILTRRDMATTKLLANSDRGLDRAVHCRDLIDLAMLELTQPEWIGAAEKAQSAYGESVIADLITVADRLRDTEGLVKTCIEAMEISIPPSILLKRINTLKQLALTAS